MKTQYNQKERKKEFLKKSAGCYISNNMDEMDRHNAVQQKPDTEEDTHMTPFVKFTIGKTNH